MATKFRNAVIPIAMALFAECLLLAEGSRIAEAQTANACCTPAHECIPYSSYGCKQNVDGSCNASGAAPCSGSSYSTACAGACGTKNPGGAACNSNIGNVPITVHLMNFTCGPPGSCSCTASNPGLGVKSESVSQCSGPSC